MQGRVSLGSLVIFVVLAALKRGRKTESFFPGGGLQAYNKKVLRNFRGTLS